MEASVEELPPRPIRQGIRPEPQPSLEGQDTVADLYLLNRQYAKEQAVPAAVLYHGLAGDLAAEERGEYGMTPMDLVEKLPAALRHF